MTDNEIKRRKAICDAAGVDEIGELSDGFHTFNSLYEQRMILFAALVKAYKDKSWKSYRHEDGELCFGGGWFIVGIDTPEGSYTYHYENNYYSLFDCEELECGKHWDGHTEKDVTRLLSLPSAEPEIVRCKDCKHRMPYDWMFSEIWRSQNINDYSEDEIGCQYCDMTMKADDFCSRAERRTDER